MTIRLTSSAFTKGGSIPEEYTCDGVNVSPPLAWTHLPAATQSLALTVDDPDAPSGIWVHWLLFNLPPETASLPIGVPTTDTLPSGARQGSNDYGKIGYGGPCPPSGKPHRYVFTLYALDTLLDLPSGAMRRMLINAISGHILDQGELIGTYARR